MKFVKENFYILWMTEIPSGYPISLDWLDERYANIISVTNGYTVQIADDIKIGVQKRGKKWYATLIGYGLGFGYECYNTRKECVEGAIEFIPRIRQFLKDAEPLQAEWEKKWAYQTALRGWYFIWRNEGIAHYCPGKYVDVNPITGMTVTHKLA